MERSHLANRLNLSYLGCFFEAHYLYHSLLDKFKGLSAHYWNQQNEIWLTWKERVKKIRGEQFSLICHSIQENFENSYAITKDTKQRPHDITAYDHWHDILAQQVSSLLKNHLRNGTLAKRDPGTENAVFPYHIKDDFIEVLDGYGIEYFKASTTFSVINRVEKQFVDGENIFSTQTQLDKDETIKDAINDLLNKHPELGELGFTQLANLIRLKYLNSNGNELKLDSIKTTLRRMDG